MAELEIPVWIGRQEKWVTGLTRRTTCDDVIYALMTHDGPAGCDSMELQSYMMYEQWKQVERPLKGRTKIMKVWRAWGSECRNVKFFIKKMDNPYESGSEVMKPRRIRRHGNAGYHGDSSRQDKEMRRKEREARYYKQERSRRRTLEDREERRRWRHVSRSMEHIWDDFDKVEKHAIPSSAKYPEKQPPTSNVPSSSIEDNSKNVFFNELVQLILKREKDLQDQTNRLRDTDSEIDVYETQMHADRVEVNGKNYVQNAYMHGAADLGKVPLSAKDEVEIDRYMDTCEQILVMQQRITHEESKIKDLSTAIFCEMRTDNDNDSLASGYDGSPGKTKSISSRQTLDTIQECDEPKSAELSAEIAMLRKEIERSITLSVAQQKQLELVEDTLGQCEIQIQRKTLYANQLALEIREEESEEFVDGPVTRPQTLSRLRSKSCEMLSGRAPLMPPLEEEEYHNVHTDDFLYQRTKSQYNSDSGVESVDNKGESYQSHKTDLNLSPQSDQGFVDDLRFAITSSGRKMVPYFTYALDKDRNPSAGTKQIATSTSKVNTSDDSNSDTGLSSLHSDDSSPVLETLV